MLFIIFSPVFTTSCCFPPSCIFLLNVVLDDALCPFGGGEKSVGQGQALFWHLHSQWEHNILDFLFISYSSLSRLDCCSHRISEVTAAPRTRAHTQAHSGPGSLLSAVPDPFISATR